MKTTTKGNDQTPQEASGQTTEDITHACTTDKLTILQNLMTPTRIGKGVNSKVKGQPVLLSDAKECIIFYRQEMRQHGFTDMKDAGGPVVTQAQKLRRVTLYEEFGSERLLDWMCSTTVKLDPAGMGKNLGLQLQFGIYTKEFLSTYLCLPAEQDLYDQKIDRVTVFLVFVQYGKDGKVNINPMWDDNEYAYELGGIEP